MIYHSITPPKYFDSRDSIVSELRRGFAQIEEFRGIVEASVAISPYNARQLRSRGLEKVAVIPLLRDFIVDRYKEHRKFPYYDERPVFRILFVGRITPHKCQLQLIKAIATIREIRGIPVQLVLVGHAEHGPDYKAQIDLLIMHLGIEDQVVFTGAVTNEELYGHFRAADAYVSFSEHEGFGIPLIEAMTFDLPVIAYSAAGIPDTLGDAGILIPDKSPETLYQHLLRLHDDRLYRGKIIRKQRERVLWFGREHIEAEFKRWLDGIGAFDQPKRWLPLGWRQGSSEMGQQACAAGNFEDGPVANAQSSSAIHYILEGPFESSYSLAQVNRAMAQAVDRIEGRAGYIEPAEGVQSYQVDTAAAERLPQSIKDLVRSPPLTGERIVTIRQMYPPRPNGMLGDLRLILLPWEETAIPASLAQLIDLHTEAVLVPSEFCKRVIRNSGVRRPIAVIGNGLEHSQPAIATRAPARGTLSSVHAPFTFLHVSTGLARKGLEELLIAYSVAFSSVDPVLLVIKAVRHARSFVFELLARIASGSSSPAIQIITDDLDESEMELLYGLADAVVLPSRGEGFCLPAAEAMARGVPVIITGYGGQLDFCTNENVILLDYEFEPSTSHLHIPNSLWVRASIPQLIDAMKAAYQGARGEATPSASRVKRAQEDTLRLNWGKVAERLDTFVAHLHERPVMTRKLRLAWVSTFNARCGIATYSRDLLRYFSNDTFDITVIANDEPKVGVDSTNVIRLWKNRDGKLDALTDYLLSGNFDSVCIQFHFSFFDLGELQFLLTALHASRIDTYLTLHRTKDHTLWDASLRQIADALGACTRLFVHSVEDVNRLKEMGVVDNVVLIPHGVINPPVIDVSTARSLLGLQRFSPIIGCFGFIAPPKGFQPLLNAFALVLRRHPAALLLMLAAENGHAELTEERQRCLSLINNLGLQDNVRLITDFIDDDEEVMFLLSACDTVVFPYQYSMEAASGAIRIGLATGRPIGCTPLKIFDDLSELVHKFAGTGPVDIADGICTILDPNYPRDAVVERQREWLRTHSFAEQARRIGNIIAGCREDRLGVEVRPPAREDALIIVDDRRKPDKLDTANSLREIIEAEFQSLLYKDFIALAFKRTLGREGTATEIAELEKANIDTNSAAGRWRLILEVTKLSTNAESPINFHCEVVNASELINLDTAGFVEAAFARVLLREPSASEREHCLEMLEAGTLARRQVVEDLMASSEFRALDRPLRLVWGNDGARRSGAPTVRMGSASSRAGSDDARP